MNKCFLTGVLTVIAPGTPLQLLAALLICTIYLLSVFKFAPFIGDRADVIASLTSGSLFMTYLIGFYESTAKHFMKVGGGKVGGRMETAIPESLLGALLIIINVIPLVFFVLSNAWHFAVVVPAAKRRGNTTNKSGKIASHSRGNLTIVSPAPVPSSEAEPIRSEISANRDIRSWAL